MKRGARIAIVCQRQICLAGVNSLIMRGGLFDVIATSSVPGDVIKLIASEKPDVVLIEFEGRDDLLKSIASTIGQYPRVKFIVMTSAIDVDRAVYLLDAGAKGYLSLACTGEELVEAVQQVVDGDSYISPSVATKVIGAMRHAALRRDSMMAHNLSVREEQIAKLLCQGKTNREIAKSLGLREKTIKHYMSQLMQKMHVRNRLEVAMALQPSTVPGREHLRLVN